MAIDEKAGDEVFVSLVVAMFIRTCMFKTDGHHKEKERPRATKVKARERTSSLSTTPPRSWLRRTCPIYVPDLNVLSLQESEEFQRFASQKVIASVARLMDGKTLDYKITFDDRPRFRFGDGQTLRAVSKIRLTCLALGQLSFCLLDQGAGQHTASSWSTRSSEETLLDLLHWRLACSTCQRDESIWWVNSLQSLRSGHLALDLFRNRLRASSEGSMVHNRSVLGPKLADLEVMDEDMVVMETIPDHTQRRRADCVSLRYVAL